MHNQGEYAGLLQELQRPINCLADDDRNTRRGGLNTIRQRLKQVSKQNTLKLFNETRLTALLSRTIGDKIEANRQIALEIVQKLIQKVGEEGKNIYEIIIPSLIQKINDTPFPESSEDLRLKVVLIFIKFMNHKECLLKNLPQLASAISKCLLDGYDQIKINSSHLVNLLCTNLRHEIGKHSINIIKSLGKNMGFNKFKVRKVSCQTLGKILVTESSGPHFVHVQPVLKSTLIDKKMEVRIAGLQCVSNLLHYFGPKYMREYESILIGFLLMGLNDESPEVRSKSMELLQKCGSRLKKEEEEETMKNEGSQQNQE